MTTKRLYIDQMGREIELPAKPKRIVSLVPSQTELLYDLGLNDEVIAQTIFCIHPNWAHQTKTRIGGTKKLQIEKIRELKPDLIIGNKEENQKDQVEILMKEFPVYMSDIQYLEDALKMISDLGIISGKEVEANLIVEEIKLGFTQLHQTENKNKIAYIIWNEPLMAAGHDTFINEMLVKCGFENVLLQKDSRYPETNINELNELGAEFVLLSSEPYPFADKHIQQFKNDGLKAEVILVDGELFSWYGSRLKYSANYFKQLIQQINTKHES
ncbi:MAG: ABC transporter substrate-binding protein [Bacteroidia bacterium]